MEHLSQYIEADYAVLSAVLYCLGRVLKALGRFPNRLIPLTLTGCGIALACLGAASRWSEYANWAGVMFDGVVQGILCTGMSVYLNEVISHCGPGGCSPGNSTENLSFNTESPVLSRAFCFFRQNDGLPGQHL